MYSKFFECIPLYLATCVQIMFILILGDNVMVGVIPFVNQSLGLDVLL